jgi:hypothetical protein
MCTLIGVCVEQTDVFWTVVLSRACAERLIRTFQPLVMPSSLTRTILLPLLPHKTLLLY